MSINRLQHIIGGNKVAGNCGRIFDVYNPAKNSHIKVAFWNSKRRTVSL